jgi:hypothetical protein
MCVCVSTECQKLAWKAGHKRECLSNEALNCRKALEAVRAIESPLMADTLGASSSEESDGYLDDDDFFTPFIPPTDFALDPAPPDSSSSSPRTPAAQPVTALVGRHILS